MMNISQEKHELIKLSNTHLKIDSGPGAGKSSFLIHFIKQRLIEGVAAKRILVLMFTKYSKDQFSKRLVKNEIKSIKVKTLHSYGFELFSELCDRNIIHKSHVAPISDLHIQRWYREALTHANSMFANRKYHHISNQTIESFYTYVTLKRNVYFKLNGISHFTALKRIENQVFEKAYEIIMSQTVEKGIININELVAIPAEYYLNNVNVITNLKKKYDYILVDEAQDLSECDFAMCKNHIGHGTKLVMVGDENQSIHEYRGSNRNIFGNLDQLIDNVCSKRLRGSYRFSKDFSELSQKLFNNKFTDVTTFSQKNTYASLEKERYFDERSPLIKALKNEPNLSENCLILREKNAFPLYELMLLDNDIPYNLNKNASFVFHKPVALLIGYLLVASKQCISTLPLNLQTTIIKSMLYTPYPQTQPEIAHWLMSRLPSDAFEVMTTLKSNTHDNCALGNIPIISQMITSAFTPDSLVSDILTAMHGYKCFNPLFNSTSAILNHSALSQVRLFNFFKSNKMSVTRLFKLIIKSTQQNIYDLNGIQLITMHEAKGSQYKNVFLGGLVDGIIPLIRTEEDKSASAIEAEKRLFYVAITRTIKKLTLLCPVDNGNTTSNIPYTTSRFIDLLTN